jgi:hypothetical protein
MKNYLPAGSATLIDNDGYTAREHGPAAYFATWLVGTVLAGIASVLLPMMLRGKIHMNGYPMFILILILTPDPFQTTVFSTSEKVHPLSKLANLALFVDTILTTLDAMELAETEAQCLSTCLGPMWAAAGCGFVALGGRRVCGVGFSAVYAHRGEGGCEVGSEGCAAGWGWEVWWA